MIKSNKVVRRILGDKYSKNNKQIILKLNSGTNIDKNMWMYTDILSETTGTINQFKNKYPEANIKIMGE